MLLVVDDSHLLDDGSAALVRHLAAHRDIKVALAQRTGEIPSDEVVSLWKDGHAERVELQPLSRTEVAELTRVLLGAPGTVELCEDVWQLTLGHPLFVVTALAAAKETGTVIARGEGWALGGELARSGPLADVVLSRLRGLDTGAAEAFQILGLTEPIPESVLVGIVEDGSLTTLFDRGLLTVSGSDDGERRLSTPHPIYADVVVRTLAPDRRRAILGRVADAMIQRPSLTRGDRLHAAIWIMDAGRSLDYDFALTTAREAASRVDHKVAEQLARHALAARPKDAHASIVLGRALEMQGRGDEAARVLEQAVPADDEELATIASRRSHALAFACGMPIEGAALLAEAAANVNDRLRLELEVERGMYLAIAGDFGATFRAAQAALADPALSDAARFRVLVNVTAARAMTSRLDGFDVEIEAAQDLARIHSNAWPLDSGQLLLNRAMACMAMGRLAEAEAIIAERVREDDRAGTAESSILSRLAVMMGLRGDLEGAIATSTRACVLAEGDDPFRLRLQMIGQLVIHQAQAGRLPADAAASLDEVESMAGEEIRPAVWIGRARAWVAVLTDGLAVGAELARAAGRAAVDADHIAWGVPTLHDAVRFGHPELVADDLERALDGRRGCSLLEVLRDHALALRSEDADGLDAAAQRVLSMGSPALAAEISAHAALVHSARGDDDRANRSAARADLARRRCTGVATPALRDVPAVLSERELEVSALAVSGRPSREIADRLVVSVRTVDNHLRSIYRKLNVAGRSELAQVLGPSHEI